jgi:hypothetical protein
MGGDRANPCNDDADTLTRQLNNQDLRALVSPTAASWRLRSKTGNAVAKFHCPLRQARVIQIILFVSFLMLGASTILPGKHNRMKVQDRVS